jgi:hypothetical protein
MTDRYNVWLPWIMSNQIDLSPVQPEAPAMQEAA